MASNVETPDDIQRQMARLRGAIVEDFSGVASSARTLGDWRHHYRAHPGMCCAAAAALGFFFVPQRRKPSAPFYSESEAHNGQAALQQPAAPAKSLSAVVLGLAANVVARQATTLAARHGRDLLHGFMAAAASRHQARAAQPSSSETDPLWQQPPEVP